MKNTNMKNTTFKCCIGECNHILQINSQLITHHIENCHQQALIQLNLIKYAYYCATCDTYANQIHYHCKSCEFRGLSKYDLRYHNNLYHKKWLLAPNCYKNQDCLDDNCKYNHYYYEKNYIIERKDEIPMSICEYDLPWIYIRCSKENCNKDHFYSK